MTYREIIANMTDPNRRLRNLVWPQGSRVPKFRQITGQTEEGDDDPCAKAESRTATRNQFYR